MTPPPVRLMIVGAPKAGTTSLKAYLAQHPRVRTHAQREMIFFASDEAYANGYPWALSRYFPGAEPDAVLVGKSVAMMYSDVAMARLERHDPSVRVVFSLRNPVDRAYSEFWYARRRGWESRATFEEALREEGRAAAERAGAYLERSRYAAYLEPILERFGAERVDVVLLEELHRDPAAVCGALFRHVPELRGGWELRALERENAAALPRSRAVLHLTSSSGALPRLRRLLRGLLPYGARQRVRDTIQRWNEKPFRPPPLDAETRARLLEHFAPWNARLGRLLGRDVSHWDLPPPSTAPTGRAAGPARDPSVDEHSRVRR